MSSKPPSSSRSDSSSGSQKGSSGQGKSKPKPFEPSTTQNAKNQDAKKSERTAQKPAPAAVKPVDRTNSKNQNSNRKSDQKRQSASTSTSKRGLVGMGIPETVSRRMVKRMALFSGIPTVLGMATFVVSYFIVTQDIFELPTYAVLLVSLGCFGLGVLGLSYGVLSSSWEEDAPGSPLGLAEFGDNWGRMTEAWRSQKKS